MYRTIKTTCCFCLLVLTVGLSAQHNLVAELSATEIEPITIRTATEEAPIIFASFPGGQEALSRQLALHTVYPDLAREYAVEGTVVVRLSLNEGGLVTEKKIIRSLGYGCDEAALNALEKLPNWNPARRGAKRMAGTVYVPLRFRLR